MTYTCRRTGPISVGGGGGGHIFLPESLIFARKSNMFGHFGAMNFCRTWGGGGGGDESKCYVLMSIDNMTRLVSRM